MINQNDNTREMRFTGYELAECIAEETCTVLYRARQIGDGSPVLIKMLRKSFPDHREVGMLRHEHEIVSTLSPESVIMSRAVERIENTAVLFMDNFSGISLRKLITTNGLSVADFLKLAIEMTEALESVHELDVIHCDLRPENILVDLEKSAVKLTGFGKSSRISRERWRAAGSGLEGISAYMAPEQTGRINRGIDNRTDLYALGVIFYEMLTGHPPFAVRDKYELLYAHIAVRPSPPSSQRNGIPEPVSAVIMKLLAKNPEDRYQSSRGLAYDLSQCARLQDTAKHDADFVAGSYDYSKVFHVPRVLYGRDREMRQLVNIIDSAGDGISGIVLVSGYSGVGKSTLINETQKNIAFTRGYFISGKFDQFRRNVPYSALIDALQKLTRQMLTESEDRLAMWKSRILDSVGMLGQLIIEVIPELEFVIGKQPAVEQLPPREAQLRFNQVLSSFVGTFQRPDQPLVIFLDDLQWADHATLKLIEFLITDTGSIHLVVIGAYRDNEIDPGHQLLLMINELKKSGAGVHEINLMPLDSGAVMQLVADVFRRSVEEIGAVAGLLYRKTEGNPFFLIQFMKQLYEEGALSYDSAGNYWQWDEASIMAMTVSENVGSLVSAKIGELPEGTRHIMKHAACLGSTFSYGMLCAVCGLPDSQVAMHLSAAVDRNLIFVLDDYRSFRSLQSDQANLPRTLEFRFAHDRVQQAAYQLIGEDDLSRFHLEVGRRMLKAIPAEAREDYIFEIANQFSYCADIIGNREERIALAGLYLAASQKAFASGAYEAALRYIEKSAGLLTVKCWETLYPLCFSINIERARCLYMNTRFADAERQIDAVLKKARSLADKARAYEVKISIFNCQDKMREAVECGIEAVRMMGVEMPLKKKDLGAAVSREAEKARAMLKDRTIDELLHLPPMKNEDIKALLPILEMIQPPAYQYMPDVFILAVLKMFNLTIEFGTTVKSAFAYMMYGLLLGSAFGDYKGGYAFGRLGLRLNEHYNDLSLKAKLPFLFGNFVSHWCAHARASRDFLKEGFENSRQFGDLIYIGYSALHLLRTRLMLGEKLDEVEREAQLHLGILKKNNDHNVIVYTSTMQAVGNLRREAPLSGSLDGADFSESAAETAVRKGSNLTALCYFLLPRLQIRFLAGDFTGAKLDAEEIEKNAGAIIAKLDMGDFIFYYSLTLTSLIAKTGTKERRKLVRKISGLIGKMKEWAGNCPENFLHKQLIMEAEFERVRNDDKAAMALYEQAIRSAKANGYLQHEALANELAGAYHSERGMARIAITYVAEAIRCYDQWGAVSKAAALRKRYDAFYKNDGIAQASSSDLITELDMASVLRASHAISGIIELSSLLRELMSVMMENAGATSGYFIRESADGSFVVDARRSASTGDIHVLEGAPLESFSELPVSIINFVSRTRKHVVIDDMAHESEFSLPGDRDSMKGALLCIPIARQDNLLGIICLVNHLTPGAFTPERLEVVKLLSFQIAISIENARLYGTVKENEEALRLANDEMEFRVRQRTAELEKAKDLIAAALKDKDVLLQEIHHRVKNNMQIMSSLLKLQSQRVEDEKLKSVLEETVRRIRSMAIVHEKLYHSKDMSKINFKDYIDMITQELMSLYEHRNGRVGLTVNAGDIALDINAAIPCGLILNELVVNSFKHAFPESRSGEIIVSFAEADGVYSLRVVDNGIGMPNSYSLENAPTLGLRIVDVLVTQLKGAIQIESNGGTAVTITFGPGMRNQ